MNSDEEIDLTEYTDRYVAFIDVLGFKHHVTSLSDDLEKSKELIKIIRNTKQMGEHYAFAWKQLSMLRTLEITAFSDNIVFSVEPEPYGVGILLQTLNILSRDFIKHGYMVRGGISLGLLHHSQDVVVGVGLIKAFELESRVANYPRIIVDPNFLTKIEAGIKEYNEGIQLVQDFDGLYYLDYLTGKFDSSESLTKIRARLVKQLSDRDIGIRAKTRWMVNYMNSRAPLLGIEQIPLEGE